MHVKIVALLSSLGLANAATLDLVPRQNSCQVYGCLLSYFGASSTAVASASAFCTSYLQISTKTLTSVVTTVPALSQITSVVTSTYSQGDTLTTAATVTVVTTPISSITATSYCTPSVVTGNYKRWGGWGQQGGWGGGQQGGWGPAPTSTTPCYACSTPSPNGATCGSVGLVQSPALLATTNDNTFTACRNTCLGNSQCASFSFFNPWGGCHLFTKPISQMNLQYSQYCGNSPLVHWDKNCFSCSTATSATTLPTAPSTYSVPSQYSSVISSACSCLGVRTPSVTVTSTATAAASSTVIFTTTVTTVHSLVATVVNTVSTTSTAPAATVTASTLTIPNTQNGTYTNKYGDTYYEFPGTDFISGDLMQGTCYNGGPGFNVNGTLVPCQGYYDCQDVCSYVNRNGYSCTGVTFTPNPSGFSPTQYSTCYLKSQVPGQGVNNCGDFGEQNEKDSAILITKGS